MRCSIHGGLAALCWFLALPERTQAVELLVPAYESPGTGDGRTMWSALINTSASIGSQLNVILNPISGPGPNPFPGPPDPVPTDPIDPNFIAADGDVPVGGYSAFPTFGSAPLLELTANGADIYGYVATGFGPIGSADGANPGKSVDIVKREINRYFDPTYYRMGGANGVQVTGIFLDEMGFRDGGNLQIEYYEDIFSHIKTHTNRLGAAPHVIANPGLVTSGVANAEVERFETFIPGTADTFVTFEGFGSVYDGFTPPPELLDSAMYPAETFAHIIHTEDSTADMADHIAQAISQNAGFVYVTDDVYEFDNSTNTLTEDPFDEIPGYWDEEVAAAVPEPSSAALLVIGSLGLIVRRRRASERGMNRSKRSTA